MIPLIAIGAAIAGGIAAYAASSTHDSRSSRESARESAENLAPAPQSYIVTPVSSGNVAADQSQAMRDSIGRFIV